MEREEKKLVKRKAGPQCNLMSLQPHIACFSQSILLILTLLVTYFFFAITVDIFYLNLMPII